MMEPPIYAILYHNRWYVARLYLASDFDAKAGVFDEPVWGDANTSAQICNHSEAEEIVRLIRTH